MQKSILCALAVGACALASHAGTTSSFNGDVFSDAAFWFSGASDANGDHAFDTGDLRDVRHMDNASHNLNSSFKVGCYKKDIVITNMPVVHPHAAISNENETCIYFTQPVNASDQILPVGIQLPDLFNIGFQSNFTAVVRFRWEGPTTDDRMSYLISLGYAGSQGGLAFGIGSTGNLRSYFPKSGFQDHGTNESYAIHSNVWADVALVVETGTMKVYRVMEDYAMESGQWHIWSGSLPKAERTNDVTTSSRFAIGYNGATLADGPRSKASTAAWNVFRGQISQVAIWGRALSAHEVAEAFGCRADKLRIGVPDGGSGEFAGSSLSGSPDKPEDWRNYSGTLTSASPTLTLNVTLSAQEAALPLKLGVTAATGSASGDMVVSANDQTAESHPVLAGHEKSFFIPANLLREGDNAIALTWRGSGTFALDALTLGGSWQLGRADNSLAEFGKRNRYRTTYYLYGTNTWSRFNNGIGSDAGMATNTAVINMSSASAGDEHILEVPLWCSTTGDYASLPVEVYLNGSLRASLDVSSRSMSSPDLLKVRLADGELKPGANTLTFVNAYGSGGTAVCYDYIRVTALPPPKATTILMR